MIRGKRVYPNSSFFIVKTSSMPQAQGLQLKREIHGDADMVAFTVGTILPTQTSLLFTINLIQFANSLYWALVKDKVKRLN